MLIKRPGPPSAFVTGMSVSIGSTGPPTLKITLSAREAATEALASEPGSGSQPYIASIVPPIGRDQPVEQHHEGAARGRDPVDERVGVILRRLAFEQPGHRRRVELRQQLVVLQDHPGEHTERRSALGLRARSESATHSLKISQNTSVGADAVCLHCVGEGQDRVRQRLDLDDGGREGDLVDVLLGQEVVDLLAHGRVDRLRSGRVVGVEAEVLARVPGERRVGEGGLDPLDDVLERGRRSSGRRSASASASSSWPSDGAEDGGGRGGRRRERD